MYKIIKLYANINIVSIEFKKNTSNNCSNQTRPKMFSKVVSVSIVPVKTLTWLQSLLSVVFPQDLLENGLNANNFAMLGLGDIVIPGIFIAMMLRFDVRYVEWRECSTL